MSLGDIFKTCRKVGIERSRENYVCLSHDRSDIETDRFAVGARLTCAAGPFVARMWRISL